MAAFIPRVALVVVVALGATAGLTYAAAERIGSVPAAAAPAASQPAVLVVPDVRHEAFVFAKGTLQDAGFAWRVSGGVAGYAANVVLAQTPEAGTRVLDTGAPLVTVTLLRNRGYGQAGTPENASPYVATAVELADSAARVIPAAPAAKAPVAAAKKVAPKKAAAPARRPAAFAVAGAPKEPLDEISLPARARALSTWLATHRQPTAANVAHWSYQHEWIVTGARFGWWHGANALRQLIAIDRRVEAGWKIGSRSEALARSALADVARRSR